MLKHRAALRPSPQICAGLSTWFILEYLTLTADPRLSDWYHPPVPLTLSKDTHTHTSTHTNNPDRVHDITVKTVRLCKRCSDASTG